VSTVRLWTALTSERRQDVQSCVYTHTLEQIDSEFVFHLKNLNQNLLLKLNQLKNICTYVSTQKHLYDIVVQYNEQQHT
jgi:hypothetical protein